MPQKDWNILTGSRQNDIPDSKAQDHCCQIPRNPEEEVKSPHFHQIQPAPHMVTLTLLFYVEYLFEN